MEKDRARRYETANGLAMDLKRHLTHEPVVARPPSTAYRFQKAWRRNRVPVTAGVAVAAALIVCLSVSVWQTTLALKAMGEAEQARLAEQKQKVAFKEEAERARRAEERENQLRLEAQWQERNARMMAYAADMNLAQQVLAQSNVGWTMTLLNRTGLHPTRKTCVDGNGATSGTYAEMTCSTDFPCNATACWV